MSPLWRTLLLGGLIALSSPAADAATDYRHRLQQSDADIAAAMAALEEVPEDADAALALLEARIERAWLSGAPEDWRAADAVLPRLHRLAPRSCIVAARLHLFLHRVGAAEQTLADCADPEGRNAAERAALNADLAFARGDLHGAFAAARALALDDASPSVLTRLATLHEAAGHPEEAKALLRAAERADHSADPAQAAWLRLRRGHIALHQGRWEEARAIYLGAAATLPGWWRVEEHLAEVEVLLGELTAARTRYRRLLPQSGQPALWLALAGLSEGAEALALREQARTLQQAHLQVAPDAVGGHALEVMLATGDSPEVWLNEARERYRQAPQAENALRLLQLEAAAGHGAAACDVVARALLAGWRQAELQWWGAHCPETGLSREQALRLNPQAARLYAVPASFSAALAGPVARPP